MASSHLLSTGSDAEACAFECRPTQRRRDRPRLGQPTTPGGRSLSATTGPPRLPRHGRHPRDRGQGLTRSHAARVVSRRKTVAQPTSVGRPSQRDTQLCSMPAARMETAVTVGGSKRRTPPCTRRRHQLQNCAGTAEPGVRASPNLRVVPGQLAWADNHSQRGCSRRPAHDSG
jgi:hypothetical protein